MLVCYAEIWPNEILLTVEDSVGNFTARSVRATTLKSLLTVKPELLNIARVCNFYIFDHFKTILFHRAISILYNSAVKNGNGYSPWGTLTVAPWQVESLIGNTTQVGSNDILNECTYTYITGHVGQNNSPRYSATGSTNMQSTFTFTVKPFYKRDERIVSGEDPANYTAALQQVFGPAGLNDTEWNLFLLAV